ncbi:hypothetical protein PUNSTDRAFT_139573 [Punctularia strigosozonata HHB-11173 SS5]|uniref:Uncharacterized protein n=1 Tax=Punctularia strigosozonata (strain HHB-11173) TaxID=741275 RepID=R7RZ59_PUNST|nr:uncharacterized protein PUNSTDRAFT_139573 [Punctularia strigosozonata HHB-11173 SS5]EIN03410.1 hypothetical protein PUNSTDRAFT_139573 [Punctularia strigosozonata HHB-11173 SS5]
MGDQSRSGQKEAVFIKFDSIETSPVWGIAARLLIELPVFAFRVLSIVEAREAAKDAKSKAKTSLQKTAQGDKVDLPALDRATQSLIDKVVSAKVKQETAASKRDLKQELATARKARQNDKPYVPPPLGKNGRREGANVQGGKKKKGQAPSTSTSSKGDSQGKGGQSGKGKKQGPARKGDKGKQKAT